MEKELEKLKELLDKVEKDVGGCSDAIKELTKIVGELVVENKRWFRAGKM